jgi:sugar/nucleoside kinase (ribokinase family)
LLEGKGIREALKIANTAAAISVMSNGAAVSIPAKGTVEDFINNYTK